MTSEEPAPKRRRHNSAGNASQVKSSKPLEVPPSPVKKEPGKGEQDETSVSLHKSEAKESAPVLVKEEQPANGVVGEPPGDSPPELEPTFTPARHGAFTQRELFFQQQEESEAISFEYVLNDGKGNHSLWLLALKNIFSKQLPNMPKEYITRLVFDRRHRSVAVVRRSGTVGFGEIAFCAVSASDQVKGFGSRLMSHTKEAAKREDNLSFFLTYADNNAVTFFAKQGFTAEVTMPKEQWFGYIKDYDGGTLMESILHTELSYTNIPQLMTKQRTALNAHLHALVYPSLRQSKSEFPLQADQIPGVKEAGRAPDMLQEPNYRLLIDGQELSPTQEAIQQLGKAAVRAIREHEDSPAFIAPVVAEEVPDYYDIIKDPVDLSQVEEKLERNNFYVTLDIFKADVNRIWRNAQIYNAADTYWYKAAGRLQTFFDEFLTRHIVHSK